MKGEKEKKKRAGKEEISEQGEEERERRREIKGGNTEKISWGGEKSKRIEKKDREKN